MPAASARKETTPTDQTRRGFFCKTVLLNCDCHSFDEVEIQLIERLLASIDERDAKILRMRYGLDNGDPMTLKEIGEKVNLSRERVRQIENEALKKLYCILTHEKAILYEPENA